MVFLCVNNDCNAVYNLWRKTLLGFTRNLFTAYPIVITTLFFCLFKLSKDAII